MQIDDINGLQSGLIRIGKISSIATHWLPNIIAEFQKDYPHIEYEMLVGHYEDIEDWITEGRADCGFTRIPDRIGFDTDFLSKDRLLAVISESNPYARLEKFPSAALE